MVAKKTKKPVKRKLTKAQNSRQSEPDSKEVPCPSRQDGFALLETLISDENSTKLQFHLSQLAHTIRANPGKVSTDAWTAAIQGGHRQDDETISAGDLARYWVEANKGLVCFIALNRLTLIHLTRQRKRLPWHLYPMGCA